MNYLVGDEFLSTLGKYSNQRDLIFRKLREFLQLKTSSPYNGAAPDGTKFGDSDKKFRSGGKFTGEITGISHAHLTHNISIVYHIREGSIYLYGVYTHDDIGTGTPPNINRQEQMAGRWSRTGFTQFDPTMLAPSPGASDSDDKPKDRPKRSGAPASYTPKPRATPPSSPAQLELLIQRADSEWPQRRLLDNSLAVGLSNKAGIANIIRQEMAYISTLQQNLRQSRRQMYPNQLRYIDGLKSIAAEISK